MKNIEKLKTFDNSNKFACITGASGLLGVHHASALLETGAGVVLTDINEKKLNDLKLFLQKDYDPEKILAYVMDVTNEENIKEVSKDLNSKNISVEILVNNAAVNPTPSSIKDNVTSSRLENFSINQWNAELNVGLTGAFLCSKIFGQQMASSGNGGVILNISSDLSVIAPNQKLYAQQDSLKHLQAVKPVTYSVIKTGLIGLTRYLATYWPDEGVRANALSPGGVYDGQDELFVKKLSSLIPMGRMAQPNEYRSAIQFLCSDASSYMNGQNIVIDGGRSIF